MNGGKKLSQTPGAIRAREARARARAEKESGQVETHEATGSDGITGATGAGSDGTGQPARDAETILAARVGPLTDRNPDALPESIPFTLTDEEPAEHVERIPAKRKPGKPRKTRSETVETTARLTSVKPPRTPSLAKSISRLARLAFSAVAGMRGLHWMLEEEEADEIGRAAADVIGALPEGAAGRVTPAITALSAPLALAGAIGGPVLGRLALERAHLAQLAAQQPVQTVYMAPEVPQHAPSAIPQHPAPAEGQQQRPDAQRQPHENAAHVAAEPVSIFDAHSEHAAGSGNYL